MNERFSNNDHSNTDSESRSENLEREYVNNQSTQELDRSFLPNLVRMSLLLALIKVSNHFAQRVRVPNSREHF